MRISDWSSDVCSSDLAEDVTLPGFGHQMGRLPAAAWADAAGLLQGVEEGMADEGVSGPGAAVPLGRRQLGDARQRADGDSFVLARRPVHAAPSHEIGRASCRERVWQYV